MCVRVKASEVALRLRTFRRSTPPPPPPCHGFNPSSKYEPLPRFRHISSRVGSKVVVQGGLTKDFSKNGIIHTESEKERGSYKVGCLGELIGSCFIVAED